MFKNLLALFILVISTAAFGNFNERTTAYEKSDFKTALMKCKPLADKGNAKPQDKVGLMYEKGEGVPQDYKLAFDWYKKAAEQGDANGRYDLGVMYLQGKGVPRDYKLPYALFNLVGNNKASEFVVKAMNQKQMSEGQNLTRELVKPNNFKKALNDYFNGKN